MSDPERAAVVVSIPVPWSDKPMNIHMSALGVCIVVCLGGCGFAAYHWLF